MLAETSIGVGTQADFQCRLISASALTRLCKRLISKSSDYLAEASVLFSSNDAQPDYRCNLINALALRVLCKRLNSTLSGYGGSDKNCVDLD